MLHKYKMCSYGRLNMFSEKDSINTESLKTTRRPSHKIKIGRRVCKHTGKFNYLKEEIKIKISKQ